MIFKHCAFFICALKSEYIDSNKVIKLIAENSIEERVVSLQDEKKELVDKVISNDDSSIKKLSIKDLKSILNM